MGSFVWVGYGLGVLLACVSTAESFRAPIAVRPAGLQTTRMLTATCLNRGLKQACASPGLQMRGARRQALVCQLKTPTERGEVSEGVVWHQPILWTPSAAAAAATAVTICLTATAAVAEGGSSAQDSLVQGMIAGAIAGAAVDLVLYPIDTIKTRLQTNSMKVSIQAYIHT